MGIAFKIGADKAIVLFICAGIAAERRVPGTNLNC